jgi:ABC-type multidrug transport system fused ATPase/permease subunit
MVRLHPRPFGFAVVGATLFAVCTVLSSFSIRWMIDNVVLPRFEEGSVTTATYLTGVALVVGIGVVRAAAVVLRRGFAAVTMWRVAQTYTEQVLDRLARQPLSWQRGRPDGDLVARASVDPESTVAVLAPLPFALSTVVMVTVSTVWLLATDVPLGVVAVIAFPLIIAINVVYERRVAGYYQRAQEQLGVFTAAVHESFAGVQLVKSYGAEERETRRLSDLAADVRDSRVRAIGIRSWFEAVLAITPLLANSALVMVGAVRVDAGAVTVGEFSSFVFLFTLLVLPLRLIGYALSELPRSMAGWRRIQEIVREEVQPDPAREIGSAPPGVGVELDHVTFRYGDASEPAVVDDVVLTIPRGSITAVVGATGSGKSTLGLLVLGLEEPTGGVVRLVEGDRCVAFQEPFLLSGTIRDNVDLGQLRSDGELWEALRLAAADGFVRALPRGLDTVVGERGVSLSGGQRQRVALARAFVRRPALLVLDDTTSALDPATEAVVLEHLRTALAETTVVMIASRPSTIALADDVVHLDRGRVAGHGTHQELLASNPGYGELVAAFEADREAMR